MSGIGLPNPNRNPSPDPNPNQVLDYVQQKAEMYDLERSLNTWRRKVEIAEVEARRHHSLAAKQRAAQGAA